MSAKNVQNQQTDIICIYIMHAIGRPDSRENPVWSRVRYTRHQLSSDYPLKQTELQQRNIAYQENSGTTTISNHCCRVHNLSY